MANGWDAATLKKLKTLFERGLSTAEIGRKLGISKNAVVGKINRLGWNNGKKTGTKPAAKSGVAKKTATTTKTSKAPAKTKTTKGTAKSTPTKKPSAKVEKGAAKKVADKKPAVKVAKPSPAPIKTASKKTKRDLAIHQQIIQHSLEMANLKPNQCRWPIGDPDSEHFHFCGAQVFTGKPYCYEHCRQAYQFTPPKKK